MNKIAFLEKSTPSILQFINSALYWSVTQIACEPRNVHCKSESFSWFKRSFSIQIFTEITLETYGMEKSFQSDSIVGKISNILSKRRKENVS